MQTNPLNRPGPPQTPPTSSRHAADQPAKTAAAFQGDIAAIALENIFQLFDFAALSGKLEVHAPENSGSFYFASGVLTYGMLRINPRKIGEMLLESGMITEEQLHECLLLHRQDQGTRPLGHLLQEKGYVDAARLDDLLIRQIKEAFFESLSWRQGTFAFYPGQMSVPTTMRLQERVDHLLLEGMVYLDTLASPES